MEKKCECGLIQRSDGTSRHAAWCPKFGDEEKLELIFKLGREGKISGPAAFVAITSIFPYKK